MNFFNRLFGWTRIFRKSNGSTVPLDGLTQWLYSNLDGETVEDKIDPLVVDPEPTYQNVNAIEATETITFTSPTFIAGQVLTTNGTSTLTAFDGYAVATAGTISSIYIDGVITYPTEEGDGIYIFNVQDESVINTIEPLTGWDWIKINDVPSWNAQYGCTYEIYEEAFLSTWRTTVSNETIIFPTTSGYVYDGVIDWGDDTGELTFTTYDDVNLTHEYAVAGDYQVSIKGTFEALTTTSTAPISKNKLISVENMGPVGWKTLKYAFYQYDGLQSFTSGYADLSNCTDLSYMFRYCDQITSVDFSNTDLSNVTNISYMFGSTTTITNYNFSGSNWESVTFATTPFGTNVITLMDLDGATLPSNTNKTIFTRGLPIVSCKFNGVKTASNSYSTMFEGSDLLKNIEFSNMPSNITNLSRMFHDCDDLLTFNIKGNDFSNVTTMQNMFYACDALTSMDMSDMDLSKVTRTSDMFYSCNVMSTVDFTNVNFSSLTNAISMFENCNGLRTYNLSGSNWEAVTSSTSAVSTSYSVTLMDLDDVTLPADNIASRMFTTGVPIVTCNFNRVKSPSGSYYRMFDECQELTTINISGIPSNITNMEYMFRGVDGIRTVDLSNEDLSNVLSMRYMFYQSKVTDVIFTDTLITNCADMTNMFSSVTLTTASYSALLAEFAGQTVQSAVPFHGGLSKYDTAGATARDTLVNTYDWVIVDGGAA